MILLVVFEPIALYKINCVPDIELTLFGKKYSDVGQGVNVFDGHLGFYDWLIARNNSDIIGVCVMLTDECEHITTYLSKYKNIVIDHHYIYIFFSEDRDFDGDDSESIGFNRLYKTENDELAMSFFYPTDYNISNIKCVNLE